METTESAITTLDLLQEAFYTPLLLEDCVNTVANHFFIMIAVLLATYPFLMLFRTLIRYCERAFDLEVIKQMEGGSLWSKMPTSTVYSHIDRLSQVKVFEKSMRK